MSPSLDTGKQDITICVFSFRGSVNAFGKKIASFFLDQWCQDPRNTTLSERHRMSYFAKHLSAKFGSFLTALLAVLFLASSSSHAVADIQPDSTPVELVAQTANPSTDEPIAPTSPGILISDDLFLFSPSLHNFDVQAFLEAQTSPLATYVEDVDGAPWTAAEIIVFLAHRTGINPQVLITILEVTGHAITQQETIRVNNPTLYDQVYAISSELLLTYDRARFQELEAYNVADLNSYLPLAGTNPGSFAVLHLLVSRERSIDDEAELESLEGLQDRFTQVFLGWFGDPYARPDSSINSISSVPSGYQLPFGVGSTWYYTSGPHYYAGGDVGCSSGSSCPSPWSSIDFAPSEVYSCPGGTTPTWRWIVASKGGVVVESKQGLVVIDHEDGFKTYYSHVASADRVPKGRIDRGGRIGHPSCEVEPGGVTNGVHVHFAIWQNGVGFVDINNSVFSGWTIQKSTHYNGSMTRQGTTRYADIGRRPGINDVQNSGVTELVCTQGQYRAEYHNNKSLSGSPVFTRCENAPLAKNWSTSSPGNGVNTDNFSVRWTGDFQFDGTTYRFRALSDDGVRIKVDGQNVIDKWFDQGATQVWIANRGLSAGQHRVVVEYYENGGGALIDVSWQKYVASCQTGQYRAEYFNNKTLSGTPIFVSCDNAPLAKNWANGGPGNGMNNDNFSVRWTGQFYFESGTYLFQAKSDDGVRVKVGNSIFIDKWYDQGASETHKTERAISAGNYTVIVEYYENGGGALIDVKWQKVELGPNLALNRPSFARSTGHPDYGPSKANDGNTSTRYTTGYDIHSTEEWWYYNYGTGNFKTHNRIRIYWETAYAAKYKLTCHDGQRWLYTPEITVSGSGWVEHRLVPVSCQSVGISLIQRAPNMSSYSFFEYEVYNATPALVSTTLDEALPWYEQ